MWYKNAGTTFFCFVANHAFDRRTDGRTDRQTDSQRAGLLMRPEHSETKAKTETRECETEIETETETKNLL